MPTVTVIEPAPSKLLTTPARLRSALGLDEDDAVLARRIAVASSLIEGWLGRSLARERVVETVTGAGLRVLVLSRSPVAAVHGVTRAGQAFAAGTWSLTDARAGLMRLPASAEDWWLQLGMPPLYDSPPPAAAWAIEYTGGYVLPGWEGQGCDLPPEIEEACIATVRALEERRSRPADVASERLGDVAWSYRDPGPGSGLPADAQAMLGPHKAIVL